MRKYLLLEFHAAPLLLGIRQPLRAAPLLLAFRELARLHLAPRELVLNAQALDRCAPFGWVIRTRERS